MLELALNFYKWPRIGISEFVHHAKFFQKLNAKLRRINGSRACWVLRVARMEIQSFSVSNHASMIMGSSYHFDSCRAVMEFSKNVGSKYCSWNQMPAKHHVLGKGCANETVQTVAYSDTTRQLQCHVPSHTGQGGVRAAWEGPGGLPCLESWRWNLLWWRPSVKSEQAGVDQDERSRPLMCQLCAERLARTRLLICYTQASMKWGLIISLLCKRRDEA